MYGFGKDCLILIPLRLPQNNCFTFSLKCFSSDSDNCPNVGTGTLLLSPHLPRVGSVILKLLFFLLVPSSYWVLCGSIYSFPLVRYSCLLSADILYALLCLDTLLCIPDVSVVRDVLHVHLVFTILYSHIFLILVKLLMFSFSCYLHYNIFFQSFCFHILSVLTIKLCSCKQNYLAVI